MILSYILKKLEFLDEFSKVFGNLSEIHSEANR